MCGMWENLPYYASSRAHAALKTAIEVLDSPLATRILIHFAEHQMNFTSHEL